MIRSLFATTGVLLTLISLTVQAQTLTQTQTKPAADKVLATNARTSVTYAEFEAELSRIPPRDQFEFLQDRQRIATLIDNVLLNKTLAIEAREQKLDALPQVQLEIQNQADKVLAKYRGQQVQNAVPKINYAARAREVYLANPDRFLVPAQYDVWNVLITEKRRSKAEARRLAEEIRAKLIAGESMETLAKTYSEEPSAGSNGGFIGPKELKVIDPPFAAQLGRLKIGDITPVFETEYGFQVARLLAIIPARKHAFEHVRDELVLEAENQYVLSVWEQYLKKIKNDPKLFVDVDALESIRQKIPDALPGAPPAAGRR